jgi:hypothetical protein
MINEISHYPYFHKTKIPVPDLDPNDVLEIYNYLKKRDLRQWRDNISKSNVWKCREIEEKFKIINLYPIKFRIFRWPAYRTYFPWHIDGTPNSPAFISLNWIISGKGIIQWNSDIDMLEKDDDVYAVRTISDKNDVAQAESDGHSCLINTQIPHRVVNTDNSSRISLTLQFLNGGLPFLEAVEKFRSVDLLY